MIGEALIHGNGIWPESARRRRFPFLPLLLSRFPRWMPNCRAFSSAMTHASPCVPPRSHLQRLHFTSVLRLVCLVGALLSALPASHLHSQAASQPAPKSAAQPASQRSTVDGVYTAAQARSGGDVYVMLCQSCHTAESHTGAPFRNKWVGRTLGELFQYITSEMPKTEPGSLSTEDYTLVLAYILRMNGMPAGRSVLRSDATALDAIRIELPDRKPGSIEARPR